MQEQKNPIPATDIIIEYNDGVKEGIILITRKKFPFGLAIPGGFAECGLSLEENARKEALEETNLEIMLENPGRPFVFSNPKRDPRGHIISNLYIAKGCGELKAGDDAKTAEVYTISEVMELLGKNRFAFDHEEIIKEYLGYKGYIKRDKRFRKLGVIGRFKPLHHGTALMLEALCENAEYITIGIGSSNKYNLRNPFTVDETKEMLDAHLAQRFKNYNFLFIPDYAHIPEYGDGKKWKEEVIKQFGCLDAFVTGNGWVAELLRDSYLIIHPEELIPKEKFARLDAVLRGTLVRIKMAENSDWERYVPASVANYIKEKGLDERFRKEFGKQTMEEASKECGKADDASAERAHSRKIS